MNDIKPLVVVLDDRHNGKYSGGKWTAWNMCYVPSKIFSDAKECADFFANPRVIYGRGETPEEAIEDLKFMLHRGSHIPKEIVKEDTEDEEEIKMKATSTEVIKNVNDICFNLIEDYDSYNEYCREEEIKRLREAIEWTYKFEVSEPTNGRPSHICRYYLCKRLNEIEKPKK